MLSMPHKSSNKCCVHLGFRCVLTIQTDHGCLMQDLQQLWFAPFCTFCDFSCLFSDVRPCSGLRRRLVICVFQCKNPLQTTTACSSSVMFDPVYGIMIKVGIFIQWFQCATRILEDMTLMLISKSVGETTTRINRP